MAEFAPPPGFVDTPHPPIAGPERLVSRTEQIVIERPLAQVLAAIDALPIQQAFAPEGSVPGVAETFVLAGGRFDAPGSRHQIFLTDGTTAVEQVLEKTTTDAGRRFRYVVWNYTTPTAAPLVYGLADWRYVAEGGVTRIIWTYSFELRRNRFPGFLGVGLGGRLLKAAFLDGPYAAWMRAALAAAKRAAEAA